MLHNRKIKQFIELIKKLEAIKKAQRVQAQVVNPENLSTILGKGEPTPKSCP